MLILGVESSCDETAAAVLENDERLLANVVNTQVAIHGKYGGVVPELASRHHILNIYPVIQEALGQAGITLDQIDALAVTQGPGLIGSLLVGVSFVKAIALVKKIPFTGVDHMTGHLLSVLLNDQKPSFPYIALIASGGHSSIFHVIDPLTFRLLGRSRDDAAGEAFDKVAKLLKLSYPGGPAVSEMARGGDAAAIAFPRAWLEPGSLDFSFSGIKTAVAGHVHAAASRNASLNIPDICASFQEAIVEVLVEKAIQAAKEQQVASIVIAGGVAANTRLREVMRRRGEKEGFAIHMPPLEFCTDNAAMIALAGYYKLQQGGNVRYDMDVYSRSQFVQLS